MKRNLYQRISMLVGLVILVTAIFVLSGQPGEASYNNLVTTTSHDTGGGNVSVGTITVLSNSNSEPWTQERMLAARPYPLESFGSEQEYSLQLSKTQGDPTFLSGSPPAAVQHEITVQQEPQSAAQTTAAGYNYPAPYVQYQNFGSYQVYPYTTVGVLFFKQYGVDYRCSAASIGNSAIWTAGHCIHKGDNNPLGWSTNVVFAPAYKNGSTPHGVWSTSYLTTKGLWFEYGDLRYDMAGAVLNEWNNQTISEAVGSLGFAYNLADGLHWLNMGYPSAPPFDGKTQQICAASFAYADTSMPAPSPVAMGCDMTKGSSGGPWILGFSGQVGSTNFLNGNNSYRYTFHPEEMYSPYFGDAAKSLYDELLAGSSTK
jgi:V8-like Glu-specific endopeptidase